MDGVHCPATQRIGSSGQKLVQQSDWIEHFSPTREHFCDITSGAIDLFSAAAGDCSEQVQKGCASGAVLHQHLAVIPGLQSTAQQSSGQQMAHEVLICDFAVIIAINMKRT